MSVSHHVLLRVCVQVQTALSLTSLIHFDYKQGSLFCSASQHAHTFRSASLLYPLGILWPFRNCLFSVKHRRKPFRLPGDPALMTAYVQWFLCSLLFWYFSVGLSFRPDMSGSYRSPDKRCLSKEYAHSFLCQKIRSLCECMQKQVGQKEHLLLRSSSPSCSLCKEEAASVVEIYIETE